MTEAMPFLQKYDITFLRPPTIGQVVFFVSQSCIILMSIYNFFYYIC